MKVLLIGNYKTNAGPSNVNKNLIKYSNGMIIPIKSNNKMIKCLEFLFKIVVCDTVLISGFGSHNIIFSKLSHIFNKKVIYLMHGCIDYENQINKLNIKENVLRSEIVFLKNVDLVLCVSKIYATWVKKYYSEIAYKVSYLNNGVSNLMVSKNKYKNNRFFSITLIGGNRNIKRNKIVCDAIDQLISEGYKIKTNLFGRIYKDNESIESKNITIRGMVDQKVLYSELNSSDLYICNSIIESFGLAVLDSLNCGCDVLISKNAGALSIMKTSSSDIIINSDDINEIKEKILLFINGYHNNEKIINSIEKNSDWSSQIEKLFHICKQLNSGEDI